MIKWTTKCIRLLLSVLNSSSLNYSLAVTVKMKFLEKTFHAHPFLINPVLSENCIHPCIVKQTKVAGRNNSIHGCHVHSHSGMFTFAFLIFINGLYSG